MTGFDGMSTDPLGGMLGLTKEDHHWAAALLNAAAVKLCGGRIVSILEGGYDVDDDTMGLPIAVEAHVRALAGLACPTDM